MKRLLTLALGLLLGALPVRALTPDTIQITLSPQQRGPKIADDYAGLSYETQMMIPDSDGRHYFSAENRKLIQIFRTLNIKSLRLGGSSVDIKANPIPTNEDIDALFEFAREAGAKVTYSVRLQDGTARDAARQAQHIWENYSDLLDYFSIGNEPGYYKNYEEMLQPRWDSIMQAMRAVAPGARFCGPDDNPHPVLNQKLIRDYWQNPLELITMHNYPAGCAFTNPGTAKEYADLIPFDYKERCDYLLSDALPEEYAKVAQQMERTLENYPFRLSETNSYWYGGLDGASNAYAAALWGLDYLYWWAERGAQGMNFHTGDRVGGTPIAAHYATFVTEGEEFDVRPLSYALKMFAIGSRGRLLPVTSTDREQLGLYATRNDRGLLYLTIINKQHGPEARERLLRIRLSNKAVPMLHAEQLTMQCESGEITARRGITIGGAAIAGDGTWQEQGWQSLPIEDGTLLVRVPAASALIIKINTAHYHTVSERCEPMQYGRIKPDWNSLKQYRLPEWYRNAKFGIWAHWGPQSEPEYGDWYAMFMYNEGSRENKYHKEHYGTPNEVGFKELIHRWKAKNWDPDRLVARYKRAGAQYVVAMANHHDNFDLWDSKYHPWNSTVEGPKTNIVGRWAEAAKRHGVRFGVSVHSSRAWSWYDVTEPYDGLLTPEAGRGTWWEGKDPRILYARGHALHGTGATNKEGRPRAIPDSAYVENYYNRTMDLINKYQPDLIYFDDTALPLWPESDAGLRIATHYYNSNALWHNGSQEGVITAKGLTPEQQQCMVWDVERGALTHINEHYWQTCTCLGSWHYDRTRFTKNTYKPAVRVIRMLADIVSKNGNLLLSVPVRADGTLDEREEAILDSLGTWMARNHECIYDTRPWHKFGEGPDAEKARPMQNGLGFNEAVVQYTPADMRFTTKDNILYAILLQRADDGKVVIRSLADKGHEIESVSVLGVGRMRYRCDREGLHLTLPERAKHPVQVVKIVMRTP